MDYRFIEILFGAFVPVEITALQVFVESFREDGMSRRESCLFRRRHLDLYFARDRLRDLALQIKHIAHLAFVVTNPEMTIGGDMNQLRTYHHAIAGPLHRALDHG